MGQGKGWARALRTMLVSSTEPGRRQLPAHPPVCARSHLARPSTPCRSLRIPAVYGTEHDATSWIASGIELCPPELDADQIMVDGWTERTMAPAGSTAIPFSMRVSV